MFRQWKEEELPPRDYHRMPKKISKLGPNCNGNLTIDPMNGIFFGVSQGRFENNLTARR